MYKQCSRLADWQSNQPPILIFLMLPVWAFVIATCIVRFVVWSMPFHLTATLLGYYECDNCKQWFHIWKHGKSETNFLGRAVLCHQCGKEYWESFRAN